MNTNTKRLGIYMAIMMILTAVATSLRTVACIKDLNYTTGFFTDKSMITAANIIMVVTVIGMFSYLFAASRIKMLASFSTGATYVPTGVLGVATAFLGARVITYSMTVSRSAAIMENAIGMQRYAPILGCICAILAFVSIAHHFFNAFITESKAEIRGYFAIASIMFLALYSMLIYADSTLAIGESTKVLRLIAFLFAALFFLYEARISLGREMWRIYTAFGLAASAICAYTSIPSIITYFVNDTLISSANRQSLASLEEYMFLLALFVFITARLLITVMLQEETENKFIKVLKDYANERERSVLESSERYSKIFASKQLSIFDLYGGEIEVDTEEDEEAESEAPKEEEKKEPMISDEAIYEAIFGTMPEKSKESEEAAEENTAPKPEDERAAEEIADEILNSLDNAINHGLKDEKETEI